MEALLTIIVMIGLLAGLDWAALKYGVDSRSPEMLKEEHL